MMSGKSVKPGKNAVKNQKRKLRKKQARRQAQAQVVPQAPRPQPKKRVKGLNASARIPISNQTQMIETVNRGKTQAMRDYLACLVYPFANKARIPDSFNRHTIVVSSVFAYPISVSSNNVNDPGYGRFAVAVQPHMGSLAHPLSYKIAIAAPVPGATGLWSEVDWSAPDSYIDQVDGTDPRLDQYYTTLTQPPLGAYLLAQGGSANTPLPLAGTAPYEDSIQVWSHYNTQGVTLIPGGPNGTNRFRLSPGQYNFHFDALALNTTFTSTASFSLVAGNASDWFESIPRQALSVDSTLSTFDSLLTIKQSVTLQLNAGLTSYVAPAQYANITVSFTPTFFTRATDGGTGGGLGFVRNAFPSGKYGIVTEYRTVGCSALLTYTGTNLNDGGMVAGAYVSGGVLEQGFFTSSPTVQVGQLQNWESIAKLKGNQNSPAREGLYLNWAAEDLNDYAFHDPDYCAQVDSESPPTLVLAGQYTPNDLITKAEVFRLVVTTVYEATSPTQLFDQEILVGSQNILDEVNGICAGQPHAMPNATHMSWISDFLGGVKQGLGYVAAPARWIFNNRDSIAGAASLL